MVLQARALCATKALWCGMREKTVATDVFIAEHCDPLVVAAMPCAQRRDPPCEKFAASYAKGLASLTTHLQLSDANVESLQRTLDLVCAPADEELPCLWQQDDVTSLCMTPENMLRLRTLYKGLPDRDVVSGGGDEDPSPKIVPIVGAFYVIKPQAGCGFKYDIGQCKSIEENDGHPGLRVLYWDPVDKRGPMYGPRVPRTRYRRIADLDLEFTDALEEPIRMSGTGHQKRVNKYDEKLVAYWVTRWNDDTGDLAAWESDDEEGN